MNMVNALTNVRIALIDQAEACETVFGMRGRLTAARSLARLIEDLRNGTIALTDTVKGAWAKIEIARDLLNDESSRDLNALVEDLKALGIQVDAAAGALKESVPYELAA